MKCFICRFLDESFLCITIYVCNFRNWLSLKGDLWLSNLVCMFDYILKKIKKLLIAPHEVKWKFPLVQWPNKVMIRLICFVFYFVFPPKSMKKFKFLPQRQEVTGFILVHIHLSHWLDLSDSCIQSLNQYESCNVFDLVKRLGNISSCLFHLHLLKIPSYNLFVLRM